MTQYVANRVMETALASGLANLTLQGAVTGWRAFADAIPVGGTTIYCVVDGEAWEVGIGTLVSASELSRDTIIDSSATADRVNNVEAGTPVKLSLSSGTHTVICTLEVGNMIFKLADGTLADPSPFRATVFVETIAAMKALNGLEDNETVVVKHGASAGDGLGGIFYFDADDATAPDNTDSFRNDNYATGLHKRVRLSRPDLFLAPFDTIAALKTFDAASKASNGQNVLVLGVSTKGDCEAFHVEWSASSSATADDALVIRPSVGAASSGNGRWLRSTTSVSTTFSNGDATPSIANKSHFVMANTDITDFDDAHEGQTFQVRGSSSGKRIIHDATKINLGGVDLLMAVGMVALFRHVGGIHYLVSITNSHLARVFTPEMFGAKGDSTNGTDGTDDRAAFLAMFAAIEALGGGVEVHGRGAGVIYRITSSADENFWQPASAVDGLRMIGHGARIHIDRDFSGSGYFYMVRASTAAPIRNCEIAFWELTSEEQPLGENYVRGVLWFYAQDNSRDWHVHHIKQVGGILPLFIQKSGNTSAIGARARNFTLHDWNLENVGYGIDTNDAGDNLKAWNIKTDGCYRSVVMSGADGFDVEVNSENAQSNDVILSANVTADDTTTPFIRNGRVRYISNLPHDNDQFAGVTLRRLRGAGVTTPGEVSNIRIEMDCRGDSETNFNGKMFSIIKQDNDGDEDSEGIADVFENITLTGRIDFPANITYVNQIEIANQACWPAGAGESVIRNLRIENLVMTGDTDLVCYINRSPIVGVLAIDGLKTDGVVTIADLEGVSEAVERLSYVDKNGSVLKQGMKGAAGAGYHRFHVRGTDQTAYLDVQGSVTSGGYAAGLNLAGGSGSGSSIVAAGDGSLLDIAVGSLFPFLRLHGSAQTATLNSSDAGAGLGPNLRLQRNSASPAANDGGGTIYFGGKDDAANDTDYAAIMSAILDPANGSEDGRMSLVTMLGGTLASRLHVAAGLYTPNASGGDMGPDTFNSRGIYIDGSVKIAGDGTLTVDVETTTSAISAIGNAINTAGKRKGKVVWDTTTNKQMRASGSAAADPWHDCAGTAVTPA